ncbi:ABC transporter G family member 20-like, partial [Saccoglossus kowalevskii]
FLIFQVILPVIQVVLFCLAIGGDSHHIPVAIVNEENPPALSQHYLNHLDTKIIHQYAFENMSDAMSAAKRGEYWAVIHFGPNFSQDLLK